MELDSPFEKLTYSKNLSDMPSICFNYADIAHRLTKLNVNRSEESDGIHTRILYESADILAHPLKINLKHPLYSVNFL